MFKGAGVAIVTPFKDGKFDKEAYERLIDFQIQNGTQALIVLGTTGEASTLSYEERELVIKSAIEKNAKRIPIIVGTGSNCTDIAVKYTKQAEELGADGILIVTPYYNKCTNKGMIAHFTAVANATKLPVILYNVPSRTAVNIPPDVVVAMSKVKNVIGVKEASGNISQILEIKRLVSEDFMIYSGNDDQVIPIYACGGHGVISVASNVIPKEMQEMCEAFMSGDVAKALRLQLEYKKLIDLLFSEVNPIPVKAALTEMKYIEDELRLPLTSMEENTRIKLIQEMKRLNLI
ncbi:4-hydroxy-tetrahydrodipicolinate synthase [Tissierella praeacuta]|uniref:4-hydroxy-tetrahydrodipicolinate synthase n=1 Tax=Tissierella praeacuta DSM 18095 TaxID=1123404 RepID=A0A1M4TTC5_9FIRM|nr:4-hydroxy-tetrahydrodipicolinate synthase [Tissierella praeacuta]MBU5255918.1 4-hydroxy-tetrahydrodipicolinate synthase [Tissierella praeacuta]TCU77361.1 4-hydroxy-tetrahydrodipicolinate synthase [Tissierella praeacuta]SHE47547.1 4-hydroxy-tetrahydrodipicolinate synthase [Tissierella praeacuta DSM 18095]SUP04335.1 Dihydrodipicolinate synthase [Tissierella praeacuta]